MRLLSLLLLFFIGISCSPFSPGSLERLPATADSNTLDSSQAEIVYSYARHVPNGTQLSLCIIVGASEKYIGVLRRNDSLVYLDNRDSVFEIGSITKTFTGTILANLVYQGNVNVHEPIKNLLPVRLNQSSLNGKEITLVDLATHTSGIPFEPDNVKSDSTHAFDPLSPYRYYTTEKLYGYLSTHLVLHSTPGEQRTYSNLGFGVLGTILTAMTEKSYETLLAESVCAPLGMQQTFVELTAERARMMVRGRDPDGRILPLSVGDCGALTGAGGIKSSVKDLVKYLRANLTDTTYFALAQSSMKDYDSHFTGGLGWGTYSDRGLHHVGAFGATGGYTSGIIFERKCRVGIILLTNVSALLALHENSTEMLCRALYDPLPPPKEPS